jgi:hypothetical protein
MVEKLIWRSQVRDVLRCCLRFEVVVEGGTRRVVVVLADFLSGLLCCYDDVVVHRHLLAFPKLLLES